jgi:thiol-disulfide isomerase/thioredoxin
MEGVRAKYRWFVVLAVTICAVFMGRGMANIGYAQASKPIRVSIVDKAGYDKVIAANKGKVIVVDCWATWCVPCRKGFPKMVELSRAYADQDVVVISLCFDDLVKGEVPAKVKTFLEEKDARFEHLISSLNISKGGAEAFGIPDETLPHCKIYDKTGKLLKSLESADGAEIKHEDVEAAVKAAIKSSAK